MAAPSPRDLAPAPRGTGGTPTRFLVLLCVAVVMARATYVPRPLRNDEGGYLLVARQWHTGGEFLYGDYFVDRPPLLLLIFRLAALTGWDHAIRAIAVPFALVFVLAGWWAGTLLSGRTGGRWAAVVAAAVMCSPGLAAEQADGELYGAVFVMTAIALAVSAWTAGSPAARFWWAFGAGTVAAAAPLVKQNLLEGLLFLLGLVVLGRRGGGPARERVARITLGAALGALVPCAPVAVWLVVARIPPATAWHDLVGFRGDAFDVIWSDSPGASIRRGVLLLALGVVTGLFAVVLTWFLAARRRWAAPAPRTVTWLLLFGIGAILAGGSFWPPYLLQLAPGAVLAAGLLAPSASAPGVWMRRSCTVVASAAVLGTLASAVVHAAEPSVWSSERLGEWLAGSKQADDTGFVAYGLPSVLETADMASPYPHLWSVPMRTLDPEQARLRATLAGSRAPAWVVEVTGLDAWGIDAGGRLRELLSDRYRVVAEVCGDPVWLRRDLTRQLAPLPAC